MLEMLLWLETVVQVFGYFGVFVINLLSMASIFMPYPSIIVVYIAGKLLNPWIVGIVAGLGSSIGESVGYVIGFGGRKIMKEKHEKSLNKIKSWTDKHGLFEIIILFAATPLPDTIVGILTGMIKYDIRKFLVACFIGKAILSLIIAFAGYYSMELVLNYLASL